jgi:hypothetical protein
MHPQLADSSTPAAPGSRTVKRHFLLFLATYLVVVIIRTAIMTIPYINHPVAQPDFTFFLERFIGSLLFLPVGLLVGLEWIGNALGMRAELIRTEGPFAGPSRGLGTLVCLSNYVLVFIIVLAGSLARKQQTFRILYIVFIGLLLINLGGCSLA